MIYNDIAVAAPLIAAQIAAASHILVLTHVHPDGDAAGSLAAFGRALQTLGSRATLVAPTSLPVAAHALEEYKNIHVYSEEGKLPEDADLIVILDTGSINRLGPIYEEHADYLGARPIVIIDHHVTNEGAGVLSLVVPEAAATCEVLYDLFREWSLEIDPAMATALLLGIVTDTQSFQTSNTTPRSLQVSGDLLAAGAQLNMLVDWIYFRKSFANMWALGMALATLQREDGLVWAELTQEMFEQTGADDEASDELAIVLARIDGALAAALFKERPDRTVKISLRSRPGIDVAEIAARFGGGGHRQASGAILNMSLEKAKELVLTALRGVVRQAR